jgi:hypothetical protein
MSARAVSRVGLVQTQRTVNLDPIMHRAERVVIVLVGLIASGKVCPLLFRSCVSFVRWQYDIHFSVPFHMLWRSNTQAHETVIAPDSLHSQKPSNNMPHRSGGATKTSLEIVEGSRKQADHASGRACPSA